MSGLVYSFRWRWQDLVRGVEVGVGLPMETAAHVFIPITQSYVALPFLPITDLALPVLP